MASFGLRRLTSDVKRLHMEIIPELAKTFLEALKLAPRYFISLSVTTACLLFGQEDFLKRLGVYDFTQNNRPWIGLAFLISFALFVVDRGIAIFGWVRHRQAVAEASERRLKRLHSLTEDEKQILGFYIIEQTKTNVLRIDDGVVQGLVATRIIYQSATIGDLDEGFAYNISEIAWEYLHKNSQLLEGTARTYRTDKRESSY